MHWRVSDLVDRLAQERRTGLVFIDAYGHRRDYAFAEVASYAARYASVLRAFGVREGERVYVRLSTSGKTIFTMLALERLGAVPVTQEREADGASTIIANRAYRPEIDNNRERFAGDARYVLIGEERENWARLDTLAQIAAPPASEAPELDEAELQRARDGASQLGAVATDVVWCALQAGDAGWFDRAIAQPWLFGATAVAHEGPFDPRERLDLVRELDVTILLQYAEEYHAELALPDAAQFKMPRLRRCLLLDAEPGELLNSRWTERFGVPLSLYAAV